MNKEVRVSESKNNFIKKGKRKKKQVAAIRVTMVLCFAMTISHFLKIRPTRAVSNFV